jgi:hypothetical protein
MNDSQLSRLMRNRKSSNFFQLFVVLYLFKVLEKSVCYVSLVLVVVGSYSLRSYHLSQILMYLGEYNMK